MGQVKREDVALSPSLIERKKEAKKYKETVASFRSLTAQQPCRTSQIDSLVVVVDRERERKKKNLARHNGTAVSTTDGPVAAAAAARRFPNRDEGESFQGRKKEKQESPRFSLI